MHILVLPSFYPEDFKKNKGIFFKDQVRALSNWVSKINVIYLEQRTLREFSFIGLKKSYFQYEILKENKWDEYRIKGWKMPTIIGDYIWVFKTVRLIDKYIKLNGKPDIIHVHNVFFAGLVANKIRPL